MRCAKRVGEGLHRRFRALGAQRGEAGSASLEFLTVGVLMLVPLVYLVLVVSTVQSASLGVEGAVRQASRVYVQAPSEVEARAAAERAIRVTLADYGVEADAAEVTISCRPDPAACLTRRGFVTIEIRTVVPLPFAPPVLAVDAPLGVPLSAVASEQVSRFWVGS